MVKEYSLAEIGKDFEIKVEPVRINYLAGKVKKSIDLDLNKLGSKGRAELLKKIASPEDNQELDILDIVAPLASKEDFDAFKKAYDGDKISVADFEAFQHVIVRVITNTPLAPASS
jgi:hypothetical protein